MAKVRTSRVVLEQILRMKHQGASNRKISRSLGICRKTVTRLLEREPSNEEIPPPACPFGVGWEKVHLEREKGITFKVLYEERSLAISYRRFWGEYQKRFSKIAETTIKMNHVPGEQVQVDFCDGLPIFDRESGDILFYSELFVGVLPFSSYTFGIFVRDQKRDTFIECHEKMWNYFGGVAQYVVPDNLKSAVKKAHRYDPEINPVYCEYGNHMGFAVLPARPRKPRDKGSVEGAIRVIQQNFFQTVRDQKFYSLVELNNSFFTYLSELNGKEMKEYGVSRMQRFAEERKKLKQIPPVRWERSDWKEAKVHPDCHIQLKKCFYSVPYQYVGRAVRVRFNARVVEIFSQDLDSLTTHPKFSDHLRGRYCTNDGHYPAEQAGVARFEIKIAKEQAQRIGPNTLALMEFILGGSFPLRHLRRAQGILRLADKLQKTSIEHAALQGLGFKKTTVSFIKECANHFEVHGVKPSLLAPVRDRNSVYLHNQ